jgi:hypothetical protein
MPAFPLRTIECNELVLIPRNEADFLAEVRRIANPRQIQLIVPDIEKSVISIRHKLRAYPNNSLCHDFMALQSHGKYLISVKRIGS